MPKIVVLLKEEKKHQFKGLVWQYVRNFKDFVLFKTK